MRFVWSLLLCKIINILQILQAVCKLLTSTVCCLQIWYLTAQEFGHLEFAWEVVWSMLKPLISQSRATLSGTRFAEIWDINGTVDLKIKIWLKYTHSQAIQDVDEFASSTEWIWKKRITTSLAQCIHCSEWVPSEWEFKRLYERQSII